MAPSSPVPEVMLSRSFEESDFNLKSKLPLWDLECCDILSLEKKSPLANTIEKVLS